MFEVGSLRESVDDSMVILKITQVLIEVIDGYGMLERAFYQA